MSEIPLFTTFFIQGPSLEVQVVDYKDGFGVRLKEHTSFRASFFTQVDKNTTDMILRWLEAYGQKKPFSVSFLPRQKLPDFTKAVLNRMKEVPFGEVVSYSDIARLAGSAKAVRAVGTICKENRYPLFIPCHRVVRKGGALGEFAFGSVIKNLLLEFEERPTL